MANDHTAGRRPVLVNTLAAAAVAALAAVGVPAASAEVPPAITDHAPYPPRLLSFTPDPRAPLTRFYILLDPYADPDGGEVPKATEWRISTPGGGPVYRSTAAAPPGTPADVVILPPGVLEARHAYTVTVRFQDPTGLWSDGSPPFALTTFRTDPADPDGDGVADWAEAHPARVVRAATPATVFRAAVAGATVELELQGGTLVRLTSLAPRDLPVLRHLPAGTLPYGLFGLRVAVAEPGATAGLTFRLPAAPPAEVRWLDVHPAVGPVPGPEMVVVAGRSLTVRVTDGGTGDVDGVANGVVVVLGGPARPEPPDAPEVATPVPDAVPPAGTPVPAFVPPREGDAAPAPGVGRSRGRQASRSIQRGGARWNRA